MKKIIFTILLLAISFGYLFAESPYNQMKSLYDSKDYELAANYIKDAISQSPKDIDVYILAGDIYFELEKLDSALIFYRKANDIRSKQPIVLRKIGTTLSLKGEHQKAIEVLKDLVDIDSKDAHNMLVLGQAYIRADSLRQAELVITKARELNRNIPDAYVALGDLYFAQRVYELARSNYEQALNLDDNLTEARVKLATAYYWLANREVDNNLSQELYKRSLKEWSIVTQKDPKNAKAFFEAGKILFLSHLFADAAPYLYKYIQLRPTGSLGRWYLAQCLFELGQCDSALPQLTIVSKEIDSVKSKATLKLAQCYFEQKQLKQCIELYTQIKSSGKLDNVDLERLAVATFRTGDTVKAIVYYKELIDHDPSKCQTMFQLGNLTLYMKKYEEALYFFDKYVEHCKDSSTTPKSYYYLAYCSLNLQRPDSAVMFIKKSQSIDPNYIDPLILLGDVYSARKENDSAISTFKLAIENGSKDTAKYSRELTQAYTKLSGLLIKNNYFDELNKITKEWTASQPNSEWAWLFYAVSYQGMRDIENAMKYYKKTLQINPKNGPAKDNLKKLEQVERQQKKQE